ncbi:MAG: cell surface protein SprA [Candidatus Eisenbacteria bacterium]|nr:cell surface protein SprA [Candidatus Eisenbacteria bacterium]
MVTSLTWPVLALVLSIPGFGLKIPEFRHRHHVPSAADSLPPLWFTASRLALEDQVVFAALPPLTPRGPALKVSPDPRTLHIAYDPDSSAVVAQSFVGDVALPGAERVGMAAYARELTLRNYQRLWRQQSVEHLNSLGANASTVAARTGLSFALPSPLPSRIQSMLGPGGPALNVSGSENIVLAGQSNWTNQQIGLLGQAHSLFPSLDMQQNLDIRLEGQLSDRIRVNLLQNSTNQIPLSNKIAINYKGDEDDLVQEFDLGNTSLSLPGTQYVSYSGKNEGLFGIKTAGRVGPLDFTVLASKQEGRSERASYGGGASRQSNSVLDVDYLRGTYFFLYDPNTTELRVKEDSLKVFLDNATLVNDVNRIRGRALVDPVAGTDTTSVHGNFKRLVYGADHDYEILHYYGPNFIVLHLKQPLDPHGNQCLAVTYRASNVDANLNPIGASFAVGGTDVTLADGTVEREMKLIRAPDIRLVTETPSGFGGSVFYSDSGAFNVTRELELKNIYQLGGQRIDPRTFVLGIHRGTEQPFRTSIQIGTESIPYIEAAGLDNYDETHGAPVSGHDGKLDGTAAGPDNQLRVAVDFENGTLFLPDPRPFAPRLGPGGKAFDDRVSALLDRRIALIGPADSTNAANPRIYSKFQNQEGQDAQYYIDVDFSAASVGNEIQLGRGNILQGSDVVTVNGIPWQRDKDYTIDYDLGRVTLKRAVDPSAQLNIDYAYAPLFQQAGRTLIGSAFRAEGREKSAAGAFIYESHGAQDLRPRLGEEPSRSVIGDLNGDWTTHPQWVTRMVDRLPGVRTTAPSDFHAQAEVGASFPNPNTQNQIYVDDMEGVRDAGSLSMGPERWHWGSEPTRLVAGIPESLNVLDHFHNGEIHWYSPPSVVKEKDLKPTLTQAQGGENSRQVLALSVPRRPLTARNDFAGGDYDTLWAGLTYLLDPVGLDLSRSQFIELWVNDFNDEHVAGQPQPRVRGRHLKLHIDLGRVSEDMQRSPDQNPNKGLDTEDRNRDGQLEVSGGVNEDVGYDDHVDPANVHEASDSVETAPILDLTTASASDPHGDTFRSTDQAFTEVDPRRYRFTNGTEDNKNINPNPDTEDLNLNGVLDTQEAYFEYTVDLGDTSSSYPYLAQGGDLQKEKAKGVPGYESVASDNGWRRYRIPIADSLAVAFNKPNLVFAQHVRVWIEGIINPDPDPDSTGGADPKKYPVRPLLMLGALDIVGSRWQMSALDSNTRARGTTVTLNSVNTVDNSNIYTPPFDPGQTLNGSQSVTRREQSLAVEFTDLYPNDTLSAFKTFSIDEDYSRYGNLDWYAAGYKLPGYVAGVDSLYYFVRFSSDEVEHSYYEYRALLPPSSSELDIHWQRVMLKLTTLSNLKLNPDFPRTDPVLYFAPGAGAGETYVIKGHPSFTRIRRVSIGLINPAGSSSKVYHSGQLWFDELRATDVARDVGRAERVQINGRLANLMTYNFGYNGRDADFLSVGETRGQGVTASQINFTSGFDLHRFFEGTGVVLPISYAYSRSSSRPRYSAGDDVVRTDQQAAASETRTESRGWSTSYRRGWSERSNPLLRFTIGGITASVARTLSVARSPSFVDSTKTVNGAVSYSIAPRKLFSFPLPGTRARLFILPEHFFWNYTVGTRESRTYDRLSDSTRSLVLRNTIHGRTGFVAFGGDFRPVDLLHHHFEGTRNLTLGALNQQIGFINLGRVVNWRQSVDSHYAMNRGPWLRPALGWSTSYVQFNGPELSPDLSVRSVANGQSGSVTWTLPFGELARAQPARPDTTHRERRRSFGLSQLMSHLGEVGSEASYGASSGYTRLIGTPSLAYLFGLTKHPGLGSDSTARVRAQFGNISSDQLEWQTQAHTRVTMLLGSALNVRGEYSSRAVNQNAVQRLSLASHFPDFDLDFGRLATAVRLDRLLHDPRLRSNYSRSTQSEFEGVTNNRLSVATGSQWQPLIGVDGALRNGTRAELKVNLRSSKREDLQLERSVTQDQDTDFTFNLNRTYTQGQKVKILGRESTVRSTVTLGLSTIYSRRDGDTRRAGDTRPVLPIHEDRLSLNGSGSYAFSTNVTGNVLLGFGQTRDLVRDIIRRNVRIEARGQFTF